MPWERLPLNFALLFFFVLPKQIRPFPVSYLHIMAGPRPVEYAPSAASDAGEQTLDPDEEHRDLLAWFEIESATFGEFKQGQSSTCDFLYRKKTANQAFALDQQSSGSPSSSDKSSRSEGMQKHGEEKHSFS
jgi:hypothetical protein